MRYYLRDVVIEVTRRCNMCCEHCLRGDAQNLDIDTAYIDKLLEHCSSIGHITFTGGEPSLNVQAIEYTLNKCKQLNISVGGFFIATNGKANIEALAMASLRWYAYCEEKECCSIAMSKDMFHDYVDDGNADLLKGLSFCTDEKVTDFDRAPLLNEGRAKELKGFNKRELFSNNAMLDIELYDDNYDVDSLVYLSANGELRDDCDTSYDNTQHTVGNLRNESMLDVIDRHYRLYNCAA